MAGINREKIASRLYRQLERKGLLKEIKILRTGLNAFKEKQEDLYVCTVKAYYYKKENKIVIKTDIAATINSQYNDRLLVIFNEESQKIKKDDYFILNNTKFKIIEPNNVEDIVFDMYLDRM